MAFIYHVDIEDTAGNTLAVIKNPISFSCTIRIAQKGDYQLIVSGFDPVVYLFDYDYIVRFWRKDTNADPNIFVNIFNGIHKTYNKSLTQSGNKTFNSYGPDSMELLDKSFILYPPSSNQANKTAVASTAIVEFVKENIGSSATIANGRRVNGTNPITVVGLSGLGPLWSDEVSNKNLLTTIQNIRDFCRQNNIQLDFEVEYLGNYQWQFLVKTDLYTDRTNVGLNPTTGRNASGNIPIVFSPLYNNVKNFFESESRYNEVNSVTAIGAGVGSLQQTATVRNITSVNKSPIGQRETVVASNDSSSAQLTNVAESALYEYLTRSKVSFEPLFNNIKLWRDIFPGDFVTAVSESNEVFHQQLVEVDINASQSQGGNTIERLRLGFEEAVGFA